MKEIVYEFLYCPCIFESGFITISLHRTYEGAEKAMNKHKQDAFDAHMKDVEALELTLEDWQFAEFEKWKVQEIEIFD